MSLVQQTRSGSRYSVSSKIPGQRSREQSRFEKLHPEVNDNEVETRRNGRMHMKRLVKSEVLEK